MKVLAVLKTNDGAAWFVRQAEALARSGHDLTVVVPDADGCLGHRLRARGVKVLSGPSSLRPKHPVAVLADLLTLRRLIRTESPDVLFYQLFSSAVMARIASLRLGIPRVHMVPGPLFLEAPVTRTVERCLARLDDVLIAASDYTADQYRTLGLDPARIVSTPYGVDLDTFKPVDAAERLAARAALDIDVSSFTAVMVAYVYGPKLFVHSGEPIKGHELLIRAWRRYQAEGGTGTLLLVGGGFDRRGSVHKNDLIRRYGIGPGRDIRWADTVADVRLYYAAADISVAPSLSENHGSALEASALGVPSIVSCAGGLPEVIDSSRGWVVATGDVDDLAAALSAAATAAATGTLQRMGARARSHVADAFDLSSCNARVIGALATAASHR